jgi:hypothetical protein
MYAAVIPQKTACFHSLNVIRGFKSKSEAYYYVGMLNSLVYEFLIRQQSKNNNISIFYIKLNPIPEFNNSKTDQEIVKISEKLSYGHDAKLEAKLDLLVAEKYGFNNEDFQVILDSFEKIDKSHFNRVVKKAA